MRTCCHYDCSNRTSFGYCKTTVCINSNYATEWIASTWNKTEQAVYNPLTNSDRIRSMTDEELADFLNEVNMTSCSCAMGKSPCDAKDCPCWLDWLKEEVKE